MIKRIKGIDVDTDVLLYTDIQNRDGRFYVKFVYLGGATSEEIEVAPDEVALILEQVS